MRLRLANALHEKCHELQSSGTTHIKQYEIAFQDVIEEVFPDKCWWEVTGCEIFLSLLENDDPEKVIIEILKKYKGE